MNDLSAFSYNARVKVCKEISILYAYDIEEMEPICAEVFPGNSIDASSYKSFIRDNDIKKGIIVADKGFPPSRIQTELCERPGLHFLTPIKRNDIRIANNDMLSFDEVLSGIGDRVLYKKVCIRGGRYLYSFKSARKASMEEADYLDRREKHNDFISKEHDKKHDLFGVIVFESDQDLDPATAYRCYDERWVLELVFNRFKNDSCLDKTNVQGDFSVIGSEFINFIATTLTCRLFKKARDTGILNDLSYGNMMENLRTAWRRADAPEGAVSDDGYRVHTLNTVFEDLKALGLSKPAPKLEQKKPGRMTKTPKADKPKRPRGQPKKNP